MISEKQLAANRRNAQLSRGPVSAVGKRRSALNNLRHGLTGQTTVLSDEDRVAHDRFCAGIVACLRPVGILEAQIAQSVADDHWRLGQALSPKCVGAPERRGRNMFALGHYDSPAPDDHSEDPDLDAALNSARVFLADAKQFALLSIYEQRIHRNLQKSMAELRELQSSRLKTAPLPSADKPRPKPVSNLTNVRPENGFVFANDRIPAAAPPDLVRNPTQSAEIGVPAAT